jgi:hypothetical protein
MSLNHFKNEEINEFNIGEFIKEMNSNIKISNINKPFMIKVKQLTLLNEFTAKVAKEINSQETSLMLTAQLFNGNVAITQLITVLIDCTLNSEISVILMQNFNFVLSYSEIPVHCNIIFKLKAKMFHKKENKYKYKTVTWVNFKLFDHLKRLKTGIINIFYII